MAFKLYFTDAWRPEAERLAPVSLRPKRFRRLDVALDVACRLLDRGANWVVWEIRGPDDTVVMARNQINAEFFRRKGRLPPSALPPNAS